MEVTSSDDTTAVFEGTCQIGDSSEDSDEDEGTDEESDSSNETEDSEE